MKRLLLFMSFIAFSFFACEEISPVVTGSMPGGPTTPTPPSDQRRQVIIEEFTGVSCIQCPAGSAVIEDLLAIHGQRLIAISIHTGQFSNPYPQNAYDFRTDEGANLINYVGQPNGYPSAVVDRKKFDGEFDLQLGRNDWAPYIEEDTAIAPKVKIDIQPTFNATDRSAAIDVTLFVEETITDPDVRLSILFTEDNIIDHQLTPESSPATDPNYKHKHVLRGMATPYDGIPITDGLLAGAQIVKSFNYAIPAGWKEDNVHVIAVFSLAGDRKDVLQAHQVDLVK